MQNEMESWTTYLFLVELQEDNIAQPKTDKWFSFPSRFASFVLTV